MKGLSNILSLTFSVFKKCKLFYQKLSSKKILFIAKKHAATPLSKYNKKWIDKKALISD